MPPVLCSMSKTITLKESKLLKHTMLSVDWDAGFNWYGSSANNHEWSNDYMWKPIALYLEYPSLPQSDSSTYKLLIVPFKASEGIEHQRLWGTCMLARGGSIWSYPLPPCGGVVCRKLSQAQARPMGSELPPITQETLCEWSYGHPKQVALRTATQPLLSLMMFMWRSGIAILHTTLRRHYSMSWKSTHWKLNANKKATFGCYYY